MRAVLTSLILLVSSARASVDFDREIRPVLSENCFTCHGPDATKRMANLRLDTADGGAFTNNVVVAGNSQASRLFQRVSDPDTARRMPPVYSGHTLTTAQIALIRQWIDDGAKWQTHWAFLAPKHADSPPVKDASWPRNPIDNFILARLDRENLRPSPPADKATLLRRLSYDLTGLPPSIDDLNSFLADKSPNAWEKRVDSLLASPRYGERMAMPWLDLARYADTHGYHIDSSREMWHWRDWVVDAFNRNMPYDEFTVDQLAGDLIPNATVEQKLASGFNRNHMINFEGGAIPEEYQVEYVVDRVETTANTWMGLTMGCARCHDHKYDPIAQKDFYRFFAFFNNVSEKGLDGRNGNAEPFLALPSPLQQARQTELKAAIAAHEQALPEDVVAKLQTEWEKTADFSVADRDGLLAHFEFDGNLADSSGHYLYGRVTHGDVTYANAAVDRGVDFDGETRATFGHIPVASDKPFAVAFWLKINGKLKDPVFAQGTFGISLDDFELSGIQQRVPRLYLSLAGLEVRTSDRLPWPDNMNHIAVNYDGSGTAKGFRIFVNGRAVTLETLKNDASSAPATGPLEIDSFKGRLDDLRFYDRPLDKAALARLRDLEPLRAILAILPDKRSKEQKAWIRDYYLSGPAPEPDRTAWAELKTLREQEKTLTAEIPTTMVMSELTAEPRASFVLGRGDYRNQTEKVTPGTPPILPPLPKDAPANRLTLAKWLVDPANPLTARVAVNRFWQMYFGTGIVKTAENFGSQGEPPSNPELLDWLATEFIRSGWNVKAMQRLIVTSATYQQSSRVTPEMLEKDPENRLLARGPRFRLQAEMIRDGELSIAGLLKEKPGGPGVHPYQPPGLWEEIAFGDGFTSQTYTQDHGDDLYRRSLYTFWKRTSPPPSMITFDAPDREKCSARRTITNTPLQALAMLNDPEYMEAARALAARMVTQGGKDRDARLAYGFRLATARQPAPRELIVLRTALDAELASHKQPEAAWTTVAGMILNLDETISKE